METHPQTNDSPPVLAETIGRIGRLTMNRADGFNILTEEMIAGLKEALEKMGADSNIRVVVLAATGKAFCVGHDMKAMNGGTQEDIHALFEHCSEMMLTIRGLPKPVIAQVQGTAVAAGAQLAATCDLVVASTEARFGTTGIKNGLFCFTPMIPISRIMSHRKSLELLLTGDIISAEQAERYDLVNQVAPPENLEAQTLALAEKIARNSPYTLSEGKRSFYQQLPMNFENASQLGKQGMIANVLAPEGQEGIRSFVEKRPPNWQKD